MNAHEAFGVTIGLVATCMSVFFTMLAYKAAEHKRVEIVHRLLMLSGCLSIGCWLVMAAVIYRFEEKIEVLLHARTEANQPHINADQIDNSYATRIVTGQGNVIEFGDDRDARLYRTMGNFRFTHGPVGSSDRSGRGTAGTGVFPHPARHDRPDGRPGL